jgi:hypothetical protein
MKHVILTIVAGLCCLVLTACAATPPVEATPLPTATPTAAPTATPEITPTPVPTPVYDTYAAAKALAVQSLEQRLSSTREQVYVYNDFGLTENNFTQKAKIFGNHAEFVQDLDENWQTDPYSGNSCIRCDITTKGTSWGGWMFLNGYLPEGETQPKLNDGNQKDAGLDLSGATALWFYARGEQGGERVEFFTCGFGYDGEDGFPIEQYPDSEGKHSLGFITLTNEWKAYTIPLDFADLSNIQCGFGFVCSGNYSDDAKNVFYLDEIAFLGDIASAKEAPVLLRSYDTDNQYIQNAAFSYDSALASMALLSDGMVQEAGEIADAFVYAVQNDRQGVSRVRNAYAAGNIAALPGWESGARLPGWYEFDDKGKGTWYEDQYQVGSNVGNTSYVTLALLQYYRVVPDAKYLDTAKALMDWVIDSCSDGGDGFTGGFDGWAEGKKPVITKFTYKSIEHNIDAYAAFTQLYALTGEPRYQAAAESALRFIKSMYDPAGQVFYTGTTEDGITPSKDNIVLDAQVWAAMALGEQFQPYESALSRVKTMRVTGGGYPFCESNANGGWWAEGTAYTALMYRLRGDDAAATEALDALASIQREDGLFPAATVDNLSTGFNLFTGDPWEYGTAPHIAPTAWFILAVNNFNPYTFE